MPFHARATKRKTIGALFGAWLGLTALWTAFVGQFDPQEVVGGLIISALVAAIAASGNGASWVAIQSPRRLHFSPSSSTSPSPSSDQTCRWRPWLESTFIVSEAASRQ